jgi:Na+-translocating ferredoxin:NAD+ oxidoreductase RnfC subunit
MTTNPLGQSDYPDHSSHPDHSRHGAEEPLCLNCLACIQACPEGMVPNFLYHACIHGSEDFFEPYRLADCSLCGACTRVCPGDLPLDTVFAKTQRAVAAVTAPAPVSIPTPDPGQ